MSDSHNINLNCLDIADVFISGKLKFAIFDFTKCVGAAVYVVNTGKIPDHPTQVVKWLLAEFSTNFYHGLCFNDYLGKNDSKDYFEGKRLRNEVLIELCRRAYG